MPSKSAISLESIMDILKDIQQTQSAHTDMLNKLASVKVPSKATSSPKNETTEVNNKTTTRTPTVNALLKEAVNDPCLNFRGCVEGTYSNPSIWSFKTNVELVSKYKDDDKKFVTELVKTLDKDEKKKLQVLLLNKENYAITTKISKKKVKKEKSDNGSDSDSDSVPVSKPKSKSKPKKTIKVESEDEESADDSQ